MLEIERGKNNVDARDVPGTRYAGKTSLANLGRLAYASSPIGCFDNTGNEITIHGQSLGNPRPIKLSLVYE